MFHKLTSTVFINARYHRYHLCWIAFLLVSLQDTQGQLTWCQREPSLCNGNGKCSGGTDYYMCECYDGWTGVDCDQNINECSSSPCKNGQCIDGVNSFSCKCSAGYEGTICDREIFECASNPCQNNGMCNDNLNSFTCTCIPFYTGTFCETAFVSFGAYTPRPTQHTPCMLGSTRCSIIDCFCDVLGLSTLDSDFICIGREVNECSSSPCQNNGSCTDKLGAYECECKVGFTGTHCETNINECSSNPCQNGGNCNDMINGYRCICRTGYIGTECQEQDNCLGIECSNGGTCVDGTDKYTCNCAPGFTGVHCDSTCPDGTFGSQCKSMCSCNSAHTSSCNPVTGECVCHTGYTGSDCSQACSEGTFGDNCASSCSCDTNNTKSCDPVSGECSCHPGYRGANCSEVCAEGSYGDKCQSLCTCDTNHTSSCDVVTGQCSCRAGYHRTNCSVACPNGTFGINCQSDCTCDSNHTSSCDHVTGACTCHIGYQGPNCTSECTGMTYGLNCSNKCLCDIHTTTACDTVNGKCTCKTGWSGSICDVGDIAQGSSLIGVIVGVPVGVVLLILGPVLVCFLCRRRRLQNKPEPLPDLDEINMDENKSNARMLTSKRSLPKLPTNKATSSTRLPYNGQARTYVNTDMASLGFHDKQPLQPKIEFNSNYANDTTGDVYDNETDAEIRTDQSSGQYDDAMSAKENEIRYGNTPSGGDGVVEYNNTNTGSEVSWDQFKEKETLTEKPSGAYESIVSTEDSENAQYTELVDPGTYYQI